MANTVKEIVRPASISEELWTALNTPQKQIATATIDANAMREEAEQFVTAIAGIDKEEREKLITLKTEALSDDLTFRRFLTSFLISALATNDEERTVIAKSKASGKAFKEALANYLAVCPEDENGFLILPTVEITDEFDEKAEVIFAPLPLPTPKAKGKADEITEYIKDADLTTRHEYADTLKALDAQGVAILKATVDAVLTLIYMFLNRENPLNPMPKQAKNFIDLLITASEGSFDFFATVGKLQTVGNIASRTTVNAMEKALTEYQAKLGIRLVEIVKDEGNPAVSKGTHYRLHILQLAATKTLEFIHSGITPTQALTAITAYRLRDPKQLALLTAEEREQA